MRRDEVGKNHPTTGFGSGPYFAVSKRLINPEKLRREQATLLVM